MKRIGKWMRVMERPLDGRRTRMWEVYANSGTEPIGFIRWEPSWRQYIYKAERFTFYNPACMRDLATFVEARTMEHRADVKARNVEG